MVSVHGVRLAAACLPVRKDANVVPIEGLPHQVAQIGEYFSLCALIAEARVESETLAGLFCGYLECHAVSDLDDRLTLFDQQHRIR
jgi:hypothetical protein